jgi:hypothetical protein
MISIITPSRGRPIQLKRMAESAWCNVSDFSNVEIVVRVDSDDPLLEEYKKIPDIKYVEGTRDIIHSARWDECLPISYGDIIFSANDDITFNTNHWDFFLEDWFSRSEDKIWLCHGDDMGYGGDKVATMPVVHRRWIDCLGYFFPPYFDGDYPDAWVSDIADRIGRRKFLPYMTEHFHFLLGKAEKDQNMIDRLEKQEKQNPRKIFDEREPERIADAEKLRKLLR